MGACMFVVVCRGGVLVAERGWRLLEACVVQVARRAKQGSKHVGAHDCAHQYAHHTRVCTLTAHYCCACTTNHHPHTGFCNRPELVQMLSRSLPLPYDYSGLLCETLFAQLLRLPHPRLVPLAFSAIIAHTALLRPAFPKVTHV